MKSPLHIAVVGAGAFGGWTALTLVRRGVRVTLIDAWGPANSRASSGDETRLIRSMYNGNAVYTDMVVRASALWREAEARWNRPLFRRSGVLYLFEDADEFATRSLPLVRDRGIELRALTAAEASKQFPQISFDGVRRIYFEPDGGVLLARRACELVREAVEREGGSYRRMYVRPAEVISERMPAISLADGSRLEADAFVFACGPWLGSLFPDVVGDGIIATRQDVLYFGAPIGDRRFEWSSFPGWMNFGDGRWYGMAGSEARGLKVADDMAGAPIDPSSLDRVVLPESIESARAFVRRRFPALADQPIVESRVCQYEYSPDGDFLIDRHPGAANVWIVGGGSGHGFKMGPALGEYVARIVLDSATPDDQFSYRRFAAGRERVRGTDRRKLHS